MIFFPFSDLFIQRRGHNFLENINDYDTSSDSDNSNEEKEIQPNARYFSKFLLVLLTGGSSANLDSTFLKAQ